MKHLKLFILLPALILFSCENEIPEEDVFENPLDEDEVSYETPALTFYPVDISIPLGTSSPVDIFILGVENLAGSHVRLSYDRTKLQVLSISVGGFFTDADQTPIFIYEDDAANGVVDINTSFLGSDSVSVSGTGSLASIVFQAKTEGESTLVFDPVCEIVGPDDITIEIKGFGEGVVNAL